MNSITRFCLPLGVGLIYLFLYLPIMVLVLFSCNDNPITHEWLGFTTRWYTELYYDTEIWSALYNSLSVATMAVVLSISMGTTFVCFGRVKTVRRLMVLFYGSLAIPEIVLGVGLLACFSYVMIPLGLTTLVAAHTVLALGYVVPVLQMRFAQIDAFLIEAALDLGATRKQIFLTVVLPLLYPALVASALLVFIISLDDFVLSFFCAGASTQTLPVYIFSVIRSGASPILNALSTLLLIGSTVLVLIFSLLHSKKIGAI